ncbi:MAG: hypothetical protein WCS30_12050 [Selenomonadaceae bacterium]
MAKNFYQIDILDSKGTPKDSKMVTAANMYAAVDEFLGGERFNSNVNMVQGCKVLNVLTRRGANLVVRKA